MNAQRLSETSDKILKHWRVIESPKCQECTYTNADGSKVCLRDGGPDFCAFQFVIIDDSSPKTEEFNYGMVTYGFDSREQAEQYILDAATENKTRRIFPNLRTHFSQPH